MEIPLIFAMKNLWNTTENLVKLPLKNSQDFNGFWFHSDSAQIQHRFSNARYKYKLKNKLKKYRRLKNKIKYRLKNKN